MALTTEQKFGIASSAVSSVTSIYSTLALAEAERELLKVNERISNLRAEDAKKRGKEAESIKRQKGKQVVGEQRAAAAASGIRADVGSARELQEEAKDVTEVDATTIRINALRGAFGLETDALIASARGELVQTRAQLDTIDTLLSGGVRAANYYFGE